MKKLNKFLTAVVASLCLFSVVTPVLATEENEPEATPETTEVTETEEPVTQEDTNEEEEVSPQADTGGDAEQVKDALDVVFQTTITVYADKSDAEILELFKAKALENIKNAGFNPAELGTVVFTSVVSRVEPTDTTNGSIMYWCDARKPGPNLVGQDGEVVVTLLKPVSTTTKTEGNVPSASASVDDTDAFMEVVNKNATEEQKKALEEGAKVETEITVSDKVEEADKTKVESATDSNTKVAVYLNIGAFAIFNKDGKRAADSMQLSETGSGVTVTVDVPEDFIVAPSGYERSYTIFRVHDGKVEELETSYDSNTGKITFVTDKFSTYAIAYTDTKKPSKTPATSDTNNIVMYAVMTGMALIAGLGFVVFRKNRA